METSPRNTLFGREKLIELLWDRLETQSIVINAERRIEKTQILRKMQKQPRDASKPSNNESSTFRNSTFPCDCSAMASDTWSAKIRRTLWNSSNPNATFCNRHWGSTNKAEISSVLQCGQGCSAIHRWIQRMTDIDPLFEAEQFALYHRMND